MPMRKHDAPTDAARSSRSGGHRGRMRTRRRRSGERCGNTSCGRTSCGRRICRPASAGTTTQEDVKMITYWFELMVGPVPDLDAAAERLHEAFGDSGADGLLAGDEHGGSITFSREAPSAMDAILSALDDAEAAGLTVTGVVEDLVTVADIAEKTGKTVQAVGHWTT